MAVRLSAQGHFTWKEWAATWAEELKAAADRGEPDDGTRYYQHWLAALERLVLQAKDRVASEKEAARRRLSRWLAQSRVKSSEAETVLADEAKMHDAAAAALEGARLELDQCQALVWLRMLLEAP